VRAGALTLTLLALAGGLAAGCGSDEEQGDPIPAPTAEVLQSRLDEVQRRFEFGGGACLDILDDSRPAIDDAIASLPEGVDADVREALQQGFDRLFELSDQQCDDAETDTQTTEQPPQTQPETTETVPPPDTQTETTETVPPPQTETTPTQTEPPATGQDGSGGVIVPGGGG
jgi:hypothetical protein